ncbi:MAG: hypothetical protein WC592_00885 [Candidatus Omnitrophota bacterium]|nr:hypothetical protein [Candidatus Omnitrophota bacterium]
MKKTFIALLALISLCAVCYAQDDTLKATEPVGVVIEAGGVFVGTVVGATEEAVTGEKKLTVKSDTGETRIFPFTETVKIVDDTVNAVTFNQLKEGQKVVVEYLKEGNTEKAKSVTVTE